jgi:NAD(P)-dependent dehydrogenase (short-subunit alcohol dehydrogenase family)
MQESYKKPKLKNKYYDDFIKTLPDLSGKTIAITGTTSGTGYVAAKTLAQKGARIILLNRSSEKERRSFERLTTIIPGSKFIAIECDLQSFTSVRRAADELVSVCSDGLDVLCNNAGIMALKDKATIDGFDIQMQTNHLSHFLLCKKLMPLLKKATQLRGEARVVNHSSIARFGVKALEAKYLEKNGGNLGGDGTRMMLFPQGRWCRYSQTKLANVVFTACLHERFKKTNSKIKALVAHPGLAVTDLQDTTVKDGGMGGFLTGLMMKGGQTQEDGAIGIIRCMADPNVSSGDFIGPGSGMMAMKGDAVIFPLEASYNNQETRDLLWSKSCDAIGEDFDIL